MQDDEYGLVYIRARYYAVGTRRFVSKDLARDGRNWFSYCAGRPIGRRDPTGIFLIPELLTGCAEEVAEQFDEAQRAKMTLCWAETCIQRALSKWASAIGENLLVAVYGEEYLLRARATGGEFGIQLTCVSQTYYIGIVVQAGGLVVKTYNGAGQHIFENVKTWLP